MPKIPDGKPFPYQSKHEDKIHRGDVEIPVAGSLQVNLGIGHTNFFMGLSKRQASQNALAPRFDVDWSHTAGQPGSFTLRSSLIEKAEAEALASVVLATAAALPACTYDNGASGVGATLTGDANGILSIDGTVTTVATRVLVKNQVLEEHNGIYTVTVVGTAGTAFVLTRAIDNDEAADITVGDWTYATAGRTNASKGFVMTQTAAVTVGTTDVTWAAFDIKQNVNFIVFAEDGSGA